MVNFEIFKPSSLTTKENVMNELQNITQDNKRLKEVDDKLLIKNEESSKTQNNY